MKIQFKVEEYYLNQNTNQQSQWVSVFVFDKTDNQPTIFEEMKES